MTSQESADFLKAAVTSEPAKAVVSYAGYLAVLSVAVVVAVATLFFVGQQTLSAVHEATFSSAHAKPRTSALPNFAQAMPQDVRTGDVATR